VLIDYAYTVAASGNITTIGNQLSGTTPSFGVALPIKYGAGTLYLHLNSCIELEDLLRHEDRGLPCARLRLQGLRRRVGHGRLPLDERVIMTDTDAPAPRFAGQEVNLGGTMYVVPPLALGALKQLLPKIKALTIGEDLLPDLSQVVDLLEICLAALRRNYPALTLDGARRHRRPRELQDAGRRR
jgi:hypothetical protein